MIRRIVVCAAATALFGVAAGCGGPTTTPGTDTGVGPDTGVTIDSGPRPDGGDAGTLPDTGVIGDGGTLPDTGVVPDGGPSCTGVDCTAMDDECNMGVCNPTTGACETAPRTDGTSCDDGDACTDGDSCTAGACTAGTPADCSGMTDACNTGTCNPADGSCMAVPVADGAACEDGNLCTGAGVCTAGACGGATPTDCSGMTNTCNVGMCDPASGACVAMPLTDGTACTDGDLCTGGEVCTAGACGGGVAPDCSASANMCNTGACDPATGACVAVPVTDGTACTDANACTSADSCVAGACTGTSLTPVGDTCADAVALDGSVGTRTVMGTTTCATDNSRAGCSIGTGMGGRDTVYNMTLTGPRLVTLSIPTSSMTDTTLYVQTDCASAATQVACDDDAGPGNLSLITNASLQGGSNFVYVDGYSATQVGTYSLTATVQAPEACASAPRLTLPAVRATTEFTGTTTGATNDFVSSSCATTSTAPDHVFEFVVTTRTRLRFETMTTTGQYDTVLHIRRSACAAGADTVASRVACNDDFGAAGNRLSQIIQTFDPGTYYLVVDGYLTNAGNYRVQVENIPLGHTVLIGHDYFERSADVDQLVGNAVQLTTEPGNIEILTYNQYADNSAGGETANTQAAITAELTAAARTATFTTLADSTMLATALTASVDVLLVVEQELGSDAGLTAVGTAWNAQLQTFLDRGGIIIVCNDTDFSWRTVSGAGLYTITGTTNQYPATATVALPADRLAAGVAATYATPNGSASFNGVVGGVTVVRAAVGQPIVQDLPR